MYYSDELVEEVRSRIDIVDLISGYVRLQRKGNSYFGLCPFHNERTPSFSVSQDKQMFYCFGCGKGGNAFTFLMDYENLTFPEALQFLAERAGVELPKEDTSREARQQADRKARMLEANKAAARYFYIQLKSPQGERAYRYLRDRGLAEETVTAFGLGYANKYSDDLYRYLRGQGFEEDILREAGLITTDEKRGNQDRFWNRVMFPIMDANSRVIGFGGRVMGEGKPKYLNSPETPIFDKSRNLYGLNRARSSRKGYFLLCEGYMDVIAMHQAGFTNAVASLGTAFTAGHANLIRRYVQEVYLTYDSDEAGTKAALRAMPILREAGITARVIRMDPYKDPDEFVRNLGPEAVEERIGQARNGFLYALEVLRRDYDLQSPEGKTAFFHQVARRLLAFEEELERSNYLEAVAREYQVDPQELRKLVAKTAVREGMAKPVMRPRRIREQEREKEDRHRLPERALLTWLLEKPELFSQIRRILEPEDFTPGLYREVAEMLYGQYEAGERSPAQIISRFQDEEKQREAAALFHTRLEELEGEADQEKALREILRRVKAASLERQMEALPPEDLEGVQRLMEEKRKLQDPDALSIDLMEGR